MTVKEDIPEPVFTLEAPAAWNGRDTIEVVPVISNLAAMQAKGAGELHYVWTVSGGAVIKNCTRQTGPQALAVQRQDHRQVGAEQRRRGLHRHRADHGDGAEARSLGAADPSEGRETRRQPVLRPRRQERGHALLQRHAGPGGRLGVPQGLRRRQAAENRNPADRRGQGLRLHGQAQAGPDQVQGRVRHENRGRGNGAARREQSRLWRRLPH